MPPSPLGRVGEGMLFMRKLILISALVGLGTAAFLYFRKQTDLLKQFCYEYTGYKIVSASLQQVVVALMFNLANKSQWEITINSYDFDIFLNGKFVSRVTNSQAQTIAAGAKSPVTITMAVRPGDILKNATDIALISGLQQNIGDAKVMLKGSLSATFGNAIPIKNYPVELVFNLKDILANTGEKTLC